MPLFNRIASVKLGSISSTEFLGLGDLRITFKIDKNLETVSNIGEIDIYNLSEDTRNKLNKIFDTIVLEAGYQDGDGLKTIFTGDIISSVTKRSGPDLITTIRAGDGLRVLISSKFNKSYAPNVSAYSIIEDLVNTLGIPKKISDKILKKFKAKVEDKYANGFSFVGKATTALDTLMKKTGLEYSVQNGSFKLLELEETDTSPIVLLSEETGIIDRPEKTTVLKKQGDTVKTVSPDSEEKDLERNGWIIRSLLYPEIEPGSRVKIEYPILDINGEFRVEEITHRGDTYGTEFNSDITVAEYK